MVRLKELNIHPGKGFILASQPTLKEILTKLRLRRNRVYMHCVGFTQGNRRLPVVARTVIPTEQRWQKKSCRQFWNDHLNAFGPVFQNKIIVFIFAHNLEILEKSSIFIENWYFQRHTGVSICSQCKCKTKGPI